MQHESDFVLAVLVGLAVATPAWVAALAGRDKVIAAVVRLIARGFFRVGSERYTRENRTFGISTLHKRHVRVNGAAITFAYQGKSN